MLPRPLERTYMHVTSLLRVLRATALPIVGHVTDTHLIAVIPDIRCVRGPCKVKGMSGGDGGQM